MQEILFMLAAVANIVSLMLVLIQEDKHRRMEGNEKIRTSCH